MRQFFVKLAKILFDHNWIINPQIDDYHKIYETTELIDEGDPCGDGILYGVGLLLLISLLSVIIYYFVIIRNNNNANNKNYLTVFFLGMFVLVACNILMLFVIWNHGDCEFWTRNLFGYISMSIVYYIILFEVWSQCCCRLSDDPYRNLINLFKK